jgi:uncharacterized spore protein YtfJ
VQGSQFACGSGYGRNRSNPFGFGLGAGVGRSVEVLHDDAVRV